MGCDSILGLGLFVCSFFVVFWKLYGCRRSRELSGVYFLCSMEVEEAWFILGIIVSLFYMIFNDFSLIVFHKKELNCVKLASSDSCGGCWW